MDRFNFFTGASSSRDNNPNNTNDSINDNTNTNTVTIRTAAPRTLACNSSLRPPSGPHPATVENYNPYASTPAANPSSYGLSYPIYQSYDPRTSDDEHAPLSPRFPPNHHDPESGRQQQQPQRLSFLARFPRPSFFGLRPPSSNYSGAGLRGAPPTVINPPNEDIESPKSPLFRIGEQQLPSTRLHLPNLERTWTGGSNGPPTRPGTTARQDAAAAAADAVAVPDAPEPAVTRSRSGGSNRSRRHRRNESERSSRRSRRDGESREERRQRRRNRETRRRRGETESSGSSSRSRRTGNTTTSSSGSGRPPPKNFLFCFPWIKSRRVRTQILRCFVSGLFLVLMLAVYLSLTLTNTLPSSEFTILLILVILFVTIFFAHSLIKLCLLVVKSRRKGTGSNEGVVRPEMIQTITPGNGYAIPREPIRVVLARDEEAVGVESEATKLGPPAYGLWRESVRVDPNGFFWARNERVGDEGRSSEERGETRTGTAGGGNGNGSGNGNGVRRPPSYASDDGVSYVVEARPRSMAPPPMGAGDDAAGLHHTQQQQRPSVWV
ncbi:hypothetical protein QBC40DRAFT_320375 [Triangularia verruculosa]|uniref:Uncharacterized protein n=1 Tax=Triangularia verruculosa TaxID=2587418 RepID=A0AAN6XTM0_9PEZI|nr:hypothetical protein QBC40DRAFT_320375 [Triangularia verruculosa]